MSKPDLNPKVLKIKAIYKNLKKSRVVLNWKEFASKIKYDRVYISRVMNGHEPLTEEVENAIQQTFGNTTSFVPHETLKNKPDIKEEEIFLNGPVKITAQEYVDALKADKAKLEEDKKQLQNVLNLSLEAMQQLLSSLSRHDRAYHETILMSLARIERLPKESDLIVAADTREAEKLLEEQNKRSQAKGNFRK